MKLLVSACLLGVNCKYSGGSNPCPAVIAAAQAGRHTLIPVCPESIGGLPTPRDPSERVGERVLSRTGADVTEQYCRGAQAALQLAQLYGCTGAILKEKSPSCGSGLIYDGSFTGRLVPGDGVTAELLKAHGLTVVGESGAAAFLDLDEE
ncbi:MAG: DUF523 domain-containing protein [Oscillospiraceae bacterium]|nr:DUF523 domain-containing protein [Oscillospiraceae bacterium]